MALNGILCRLFILAKVRWLDVKLNRDGFVCGVSCDLFESGDDLVE